MKCFTVLRVLTQTHTFPLKAQELDLYLRKTQSWAKKVQPGLHFERFIERAEKLSAGGRSGLAVGVPYSLLLRKSQVELHTEVCPVPQMYMGELRGMKIAAKVDDELLAAAEAEMWGGGAPKQMSEDNTEPSAEGSEVSDLQRQRMVEKRNEAMRKVPVYNLKHSMRNLSVSNPSVQPCSIYSRTCMLFKADHNS